MHGLSPALLALRAAGFTALALLLINPGVPAPAPAPGRAHGRPLVLLDASLSMTGPPGAPGGAGWRAALDTARALARGGVIWRFGERVSAFDSAAPDAGTSRLGPALEAAAARGGEVIVVTDGVVDDVAALPPDLRDRPRVVLVPARAFGDAFVAAVTGPRRIGARDTFHFAVSYGWAGPAPPGALRRATLGVYRGGRRLVARAAELPDGGVRVLELALAASRLPPGWSALEVRLDGAADVEPRDDARVVVVEVSPQPGVALLASPPDWESRFLAEALADVAGAPVHAFARVDPARAGWLDQRTARPVGPDVVRRVAAAARLVVVVGDPESLAGVAPRAARLEWPSARAAPGEWYVTPPPPSPLTAALGGVPWDSLPPATGLVEPGADPGRTVLTARLARRGAARPLVVLHDSGGARRATVLATGLWRWRLRGGGPEEAYRALVSGLTDWLLGDAGAAGSAPRAVPERLEVPHGLPLVWRWSGAGDPRDLEITLGGPDGTRRDTLRFDVGGRARLRLPPGAYRYTLGEGAGGAGLVAVETYSDEWRPAAPTLGAQPGAAAGGPGRVALRDRWWLFALAVAAFTAEWAVRRRQGLP